MRTMDFLTPEMMKSTFELCQIGALFNQPPLFKTNTSCDFDGRSTIGIDNLVPPGAVTAVPVRHIPQTGFMHYKSRSRTSSPRMTIRTRPWSRNQGQTHRRFRWSRRRTPPRS
jgi:hypothetical protein